MRRQKIYPWITFVCCCLCFGCSLGLITNTCGIFYSPIAQSLQVGIGNISAYVTIQSLSAAFGTIVLAKLLQRYKLQYIMGIGTIVCVGCFLMMSNAQNVYMFYLAGFLMGCSSITFQTLPCTCIIQNWFHDKTALVTSMSMAFSGVFGAVMNPLLSRVILNQGWRQAYVLQAAILLTIMIPCTLFLKMTPHEYGILPFGTNKAFTKKETLNTKESLTPHTFLLLIGVTSSFYCITAFASHLPKYAISIGYTLTVGATLSSITMVSNVSFKLLYGVIADKFGVFRASFLSAAICIMSFVLWLAFAHHNYLAMLAGAVCFGSCYSIAAVGVTLLTREIVGPKQYANTYSKLTLINSLASAIMITTNGLLFDHFGSYTLPIVCLLLFNGIGLCSLFFLQRQHHSS